MSPRLHVGCCGFPVARARYWRRLHLVEVQATFYDPPPLARLRRWRAEAPAGARFWIKAWQLVTHHGGSPTYRRLCRPLPDHDPADRGAFQATPIVRYGWTETLRAAEALEAEGILFQTPARFDDTPEHRSALERFVAEIREAAGDLLLAWEPRGASWREPATTRWCTELGLIRAGDPLAVALPVQPRSYFRLHGGPRYARRHTDAELEHLCTLASSAAITEAWVLFNNRWMWEDATRFHQRCHRSTPD